MGSLSFGKSISKITDKILPISAFEKGLKGINGAFLTDWITSYNRSGGGKDINKTASKAYDDGQPATYGIMPNAAEERAKGQAEAGARKQDIARGQEEEKARGQIAARIRRGRLSDRAGTKNNTIMGGGLGEQGTSQFAAMLGL